MAIEPFSPASVNLSIAWTQVLLKLLERGVSRLGPVIVNITEFDEVFSAKEDAGIRQALDAALAAAGAKSVSTVATTIFPQSMWSPNDTENAANLYARYLQIWPRIARHPANRHGVYFQRMIAYQPSIGHAAAVNQLERIIATYNGGNHRLSAMQVSIFDPTRDHSNQPYLGFPCLQHVVFTPGEDGLAVTGFYAMQYHIEKAYGNYLGLARLGRFVGAQIGLPLVRATCIASVVQRGDTQWTKESLVPLAEIARRRIGAGERMRS